MIAHRVLPSVVSDFDALTTFNDSLAVSPIGIAVTNKAYDWASAPKDKFIIMEYSIKNISATTISKLYAGLFMDFDISPNGAYDRINFDAANKMSYTYSTQGGTYAAIKLLSNGLLHHYAFDKDGSYSSFVVENNNIGFSNYDKFYALSTIPNRDIAGGAPNGNDVADLMSSGPFILNSGDSVIVTFALIAGENLSDIQNSAIEADILYNHTGINEMTLNTAVQLSDVYPNPSTGISSVNLYLPSSMVVDISLFDNAGKKLQTISQGMLTQGNHSLIIKTNDLTFGNYHLRFNSGTIVLTKDVTIIK
jgi:hypothetical protein